jgi:peptide/nickel transport system substrate-binding protein
MADTKRLRRTGLAFDSGHRGAARIRSRLRSCVAASLAASVLASCVHHSADRSSGAPKPGNGQLGTITWVPGFGEPTILSVGQATAGYPEATVLANLCDNVLRLTPSGQVVPGLAELVNHPDPLTYVFRMRGNAKFWDGAPVTAADAVFSLQQSIQPTAANAYVLNGVKDVRQHGAEEFVVHLTAPNVAFPDYLASGAGLVAERRYVDAKGKSYGTPSGGVMCSGPFKFKSWVPGQSLTIARNPDYWDASREPHVAEIRFEFISDPTTLTSALVSGEVDGTFAAPQADLDRLTHSSAGTLTQGSSLQVASLSASATSGPLADPNVRQALNLAIDRVALCKAVYHGAADPVRSAILPPTWSYERSVFQHAYDALPGASPDLARARQLVSDAGFAGSRITIAATAVDPTSQQIGLYIQSVAEQIGLHAKLKVYPSVSQFLALFYDPRARAGIDAIVNINFAPMPEPLGFLASMALPTGLNNYDGFSDPAVTKLVDAALASSRPAARAALITRADAAFETEANNIMLAIPKINLWQSSKVTGALADGSYLSLAWGTMLRPTRS